jgi:citronellol/citronellal dehydrogenase
MTQSSLTRQSLAGKTLFITGASRGIGLAIALRAARDAAQIVIAAKTAEPNPKLPGTVFTAAREIEACGGQALPIVCDIRYEDQVEAAVTEAIKQFGGIDICVNNASAINLSATQVTDMKRYDLMHSVNSRGTFLVSKTCLPHLRRSNNAHILNISPPLDMDAKWFSPHVAYTIAKMGMSLCTLGMAREFAKDDIAVNSLWPLTAIDTAAVRNILGGDSMAKVSRSPQIMADAAYCVLTKHASDITGQFLIDEEVLRLEGQTDFSQYAPQAQGPLMRDFFIPDEVADRSLTQTLSPY